MRDFIQALPKTEINRGFEEKPVEVKKDDKKDKKDEKKDKKDEKKK